MDTETKVFETWLAADHDIHRGWVAAGRPDEMPTAMAWLHFEPAGDEVHVRAVVEHRAGLPVAHLFPGWDDVTI